MATQYKERGKIESTFEEIEILLIPIGGCDSIKHWVALDLLKKLSRPYFIYLDSDKENELHESKTRKNLIELGFEGNNHFLVTRRRRLENYIHPEALKRILEISDLEYGHWDHVKQICGKHPFAGRPDGKGVAEKHFEKLTYDDLRLTFYDPYSNEDEFLMLYEKVISKLDINTHNVAVS